MTMCSKCGVNFDYNYKRLARYFECTECGEKSLICYDCWVNRDFWVNGEKIYSFTVKGICNSCLRDSKISEVLK